jgi:hypothetical protein
MSAAFLNAGATSLAASNWSDYSAGPPVTGGFEDSAELYVQAGTQTITGGLSPSLTNGIQNFDVLSGFSGNIGGAAGSLAVETRSSLINYSTQIPRMRYYASGGSFYYTPQGAGAASDVCDYFQVDGSGSAYLTGTGTVKRLEVAGGRVYLAPSIGSVATFRWVLSGGTATIDGVLGSTKIHSITVAGGQHLLKKGIQGSTLVSTGFVEGLNVCGGAVTIDAYSETISDLRLYGGTVQVVNCGAIAVVSGYSGTLDFSKLQRPVTVTLLEDAPNLTVIPSRLLTITTYSAATNGRQPIGRGATGLT